MTERKPLSQTGVWLAAYVGDAQGYVKQSDYTGQVQGSRLGIQVTTLVMGRLVVFVLQVVQSRRDVVIGVADQLEPFFVKLWPSATRDASWPPRLAMDDDGIDKISTSYENGLVRVFADTGKTTEV